MPIIKKQTPPPPPKAKAGSILSRGKPLDQETSDWVHMLLYGRNRVGKTTFMGMFPKPMLLISLECVGTGGARSIMNVPGITKFTWGKELNSLEDIENLGHELHEQDGYKSIGLDSGTSLDAIALAKVCGWNETTNMNRWGKVSQDQYTERSEVMRRVLRPYLEMPVNVILTANEKDHNPQEGKRNALVRSVYQESYFAAEMGGGTTRWCQDESDFICQLYIEKETVTKSHEITLPGPKKEKEIVTEEVETGKFVRRLRMGYHPNFAAGPRSTYNPTNPVPDYIEASDPKVMYEKFMKVVRGEKL